MPRSVTIREARPGDNDALIALDAACSMGEAVPLFFDRSPDFFARSAPYERAVVLVAEGAGRPVGVGAAAIKVLRVGGTVEPWAYLFDLRVAPEARRQGVASALGDALRRHLRAAGVPRAYSLVLSDNAPSLAFVSGRGSEAVRLCRIALIGLPLREAGGPPARPADQEEAAACAALLEGAAAAREFAPADAAAPWARLAGLPPRLGWKGLFCLGPPGDPEAVFGIWDYSPVMRFRFRAVPPGIRAEAAWRGSLEARGEAAPFFLAPMAVRDPDLWPGVLAAVSHAVGARPREAPPALLVLPYDPGDPAFAPLAAEAGRDAGVHLFVRTAADPLLLRRPVFLDPADL